MPNWCSNVVLFTHNDPKIIQKIKRGIEEQNLFETFIPCKESITDQVTAWGTKWDICEPDILDNTENSITVRFQTAWSPPLEFYRQIEENENIKIDALFYESGMCFMGGYKDGYEWEHPWPETPEDYNQIPPELDEAFGIREYWYSEGIEEYAQEV